MIKRIKGSLFAKVFILTVAVLLCVSFLVYGVLAWYMPQTYSNNLNAALDEQTSDFIYVSSAGGRWCGIVSGQFI